MFLKLSLPNDSDSEIVMPFCQQQRLVPKAGEVRLLDLSNYFPFLFKGPLLTCRNECHCLTGSVITAVVVSMFWVFEIQSYCIARAGLKFLGSRDPPT